MSIITQAAVTEGITRLKGDVFSPKLTLLLHDYKKKEVLQFSSFSRFRIQILFLDKTTWPTCSPVLFFVLFLLTNTTLFSLFQNPIPEFDHNC